MYIYKLHNLGITSIYHRVSLHTNKHCVKKAKSVQYAYKQTLYKISKSVQYAIHNSLYE